MGSNLISLINAVCCVVIMLLGYWGFKKSQDRLRILILIGISFGLFAISHILVLQGMQVYLGKLIVSIRILGYFFIALGIYEMTAQKAV